MKLYFEAEVKGRISEIKNRFNQELFLKLKPPFMPLHLERFDGCDVGNEVHLRLGPSPVSQRWISVITKAHEDSHAWVFVDEGKLLPFPLKSWRHEHKVTQKTESTCVISDSIEFKCKYSFQDFLFWGPLWVSFCNRPSVYLKVFGSPL